MKWEEIERTYLGDTVVYNIIGKEGEDQKDWCYSGHDKTIVIYQEGDKWKVDEIEAGGYEFEGYTKDFKIRTIGEAPTKEKAEEIFRLKYVASKL